MKIEDYRKCGITGHKYWGHVLCEDPFADNAPPLNRAGIAFGVIKNESKPVKGFYPCVLLAFDLPDTRYSRASTGGLGRHVSFNPETEQFRFGPARKARDKVRPADWEFYLAASSESLAGLKARIERGANPDAPIYSDIDEDFYAIHQAARNPDIEVLKFMVSLGIDPCKQDCRGDEPLSHAVRGNSLEVVEYFVASGNDPSHYDWDGDNVMIKAALNPDVRVIEFLLSKGALLGTSSMGCTELGVALAEGTPERMKYFMDRGEDLDEAMEREAYRAPLENIRFALENGYDPNRFEKSRDGDPRTKVMDHLNAPRQALFREYGGRVYCRDAEKPDPEA